MQPKRAAKQPEPTTPAMLTTRPMVTVRPLLVDVPTAAAMVGISPAAMWKEIYAGGRIATRRYGTRRLVVVSSLEQWVERLEGEGAEGA